MRNCVYQPVTGCGFTYDEADPAQVALYNAHLEGHAAAIPIHTPPTSTVPDLIALSAARPENNPFTEDDARRQLRNVGLRLGQVRHVQRLYIHKGVIGMGPNPGTVLPTNSEVDVDINDGVEGISGGGGTPPRGGRGPLFGPRARAHGGGPVPMPRITGMSMKAAQKELERHGLRLTSANVYKIRDEYADTNEVMYQHPEPGVLVDPNDPDAIKAQVCEGKPRKGEPPQNGQGFLSRAWHWGDDQTW